MNSTSSLADELTPPPAPSRKPRRFNLDDLLGDTRPQAVGVSDLPTGKEIRLDRIEADPDQPRRTFDGDKLEELTESIRIEGVLQPIVVRYDKPRDVYVVVHGERRWRAAQAAGLTTIPALVRDVPESRRLVQQLMENIVRDDLNAVDRAAALRSLRAQMNDAPWEQVAETVGIKRSRLFQLLGTEKLVDDAQSDIREGRLSEKQSRALQGLSPEHQRALRDVIVAENLPATIALAISRELRAIDLPDDHAAAVDAIARIRESLPGRNRTVIEPQSDPDLMSLLSLIARLETGNGPARVSLTRFADWNGFAPFDGDRLLDETWALAQTLCRVPKDQARGGQTRETLVALRDALNGLLEGD
ncbi:MAG: ParB/RepB/Spo0J family partition protein [Chloroflexota bacterium]|nr:ParB/RepB/Spo0J family partition protein [Chloroflexota bacterium]